MWASCCPSRQACGRPECRVWVGSGYRRHVGKPTRERRITRRVLHLTYGGALLPSPVYKQQPLMGLTGKPNPALVLVAAQLH